LECHRLFPRNGGTAQPFTECRHIGVQCEGLALRPDILLETVCEI